MTSLRSPGKQSAPGAGRKSIATWGHNVVRRAHRDRSQLQGCAVRFAYPGYRIVVTRTGDQSSTITASTSKRARSRSVWPVFGRGARSVDDFAS